MQAPTPTEPLCAWCGEIIELDRVAGVTWVHVNSRRSSCSTNQRTAVPVTFVQHRTLLGALLATDAAVEAHRSANDVITVTITDVADSIDLIGSPYALTDLACRILTATTKAVCE